MKRFLISGLLALTPLVGLQADENFIMQEVVMNGQTIQYKIPLSNTQGEVVSHPVNADTSIFRLYTIYTNSSNQSQTLLLDTKSVGTYMPSATVTISSQDPYVPARTRVDQPYGVTVTVSGLSSDPSAPASAKSMKVVRSFKLYDPKTMVQKPGDVGKDYANPFILERNSTFSLTDGNSSGGFLPRLDIVENPQSDLMGEETFTVYTGGSPSSVLASAPITIWPIAEAEFLYIERDKVYQAIPVGAAIHCKDLYPGCKVYAQIYRGKSGSPQTVPQVIPSAELKFRDDTREPQTQRLPLNDLEKFIKDDGIYTIEIMTVTPFNGRQPELISGGSISFGIKRTISISAGINTIDN